MLTLSLLLKVTLIGKSNTHILLLSLLQKIHWLYYYAAISEHIQALPPSLLWWSVCSLEQE